MAKIVSSLTDTKIKHLKSKDKKYKISDGKRLYIVVEKSGNILPQKSRQFLRKFNSFSILSYFC
jgi:hypothetical protein